MALSQFEQVVHEHPLYLHRLSADQFERMVATGVLPEGEPVELIDGLLTKKNRSDRGGNPMTHGERHASAIELLTELYSRARPLQHYMRYQLPVRLSETSEPEPDGALLRGEPSRGRHPTADDVVVIFEVADSSLEFDRTTKLKLYASASIPTYVIVNLRDSMVEIYTAPDAVSREYRDRKEFTRAASFEIMIAEHALSLRGEELIP